MVDQWRPDHDEKIVTEAQIVGILKRVQESRALLSVTLPGYEGVCNSAVLRVHPERHALILDEMHPREGHEHFLRQGRFSARARLKGVEVHFSSTLREASAAEGIAFYDVALPEVLYYGQRRAHYRAHVGAGLAVPVYLSIDTQQRVVQGMLRDISVGGIGTQIKLDVPLELQEGRIFPTCTIAFPTGNKISTRLEVRFLSPEKNTTRVRLGGRFVDLDRQQQRVVERFVAYLDRLLRKQMVRDD